MTQIEELTEQRDQFRAEADALKEEIAAMQSKNGGAKGLYVYPATSAVIDPRMPSQGQYRMQIQGIPFVEAIGLALQLVQFAYASHIQEAVAMAGKMPGGVPDVMKGLRLQN